MSARALSESRWPGTVGPLAMMRGSLPSTSERISVAQVALGAAASQPASLDPAQRGSHRVQRLDRRPGTEKKVCRRGEIFERQPLLWRLEERGATSRNERQNQHFLTQVLQCLQQLLVAFTPRRSGIG